MGRFCPSITVSEFKANQEAVSKFIKENRLDTKGVTKAEYIAGVTEYINTHKLSGDYKIEPTVIANVIAQIRNRKKLEEEESKKGLHIGNAKVSFLDASSYKKNAPSEKKDNIFVFEDNLQANYVGDEKTAKDTKKLQELGVISPKGDVKVNVAETSAVVRTNQDGIRNDNAYGLVVKKNAQGADGKFQTNEGNFEDTDAELAEFNAINSQIIDKIAEKASTDESGVKRINLPKELATEKAGLPQRFAESLQKMLQDKLGITYAIVDSKVGKGLKGLQVAMSTSSSEKSSKSKKVSQKNTDTIEAAQSLSAQRPVLESDTPNTSAMKVNLLVKTFPNIEQRIARTNMISTMFSEGLDKLLDSIKQAYNKKYSDPNYTMTPQEEKIYLGLNKGTRSEQKVFMISEVRLTEERITPVEFVLRGIKNGMAQVAALGEQVRKGEISEDDAIEMVFSDPFFADEFDREKQQKGWSPKYISKQKKNRFRYLTTQFGIMANDEIFHELVKEASASIEFNENIRMNFDTSKGTPEATTQDEKTEDSEEEGSADSRSGLSLIKYKLLDPGKTLSVRIKMLLNSLYMMDSRGYVFNDLGRRITLNGQTVYYILLNEFSKMTDSSEFMPLLESLTNKYPWVKQLLNELKKDESLRNEFFTAVRKTFVSYGLISKNGKIINLNQTANRESFMHELTRVYAGCIPLSSLSIYDYEGQCDPDHVNAVHRLLSISKDSRKLSEEEIIKKHPLAFVKRVLNNKDSKALYTAENLLKVIDILRGEYVTDEKSDTRAFGVVKLLNALGVNTENLDLDSLVPYISSTLRRQILDVNDPNHAQAVLEFRKNYITEEFTRNIDKILNAALTIVSPGLGSRGYSPGDSLVDKFRTAYYNIADALAISTEAYNQASFNGIANNKRFSYSAPDMISTISAKLTGARTVEEAQKYLIEEYGQYDFFRNYKGEWKNGLLEDLFEDPDVRANFITKNILGFNDRSENNAIGRVKDAIFMKGLMTSAFAAEGKTRDGNGYMWVRNPLFSDVDALVLIKTKAYNKADFKEKILSRFAKLLEQEIERILYVYKTLDDPNVPRIEFFNDRGINSRGCQFCYFPELNARRGEILKTLSELETADEREAFLKGLVQVIIEGEDGNGGLLAEFKSKFSKEDKVEIIKSIANLEKEASKETTEGEENSETEVTIEYGELEEQDKDEKAKREAELSEAQEREFNEKAAIFFYNDLYNEMMLTQMFGGDPAYFKNYDDYVKRAKEAYACGERAYSLDENGQEIKETVIYAADYDVPSNSLANIKQILAEREDMSEWEKSIYRGAIAVFENIETTDGQSLRILDSFKKMFRQFGRWTDEMEAAFQHIKSGNFTVTDFVALWNPIKPFMVSHETVTMTSSDGETRIEKVGVQHKNSEYMISAAFTLLNTVLNKSPQLVGLQKFMEKHNIDVMHFHSVVKHGYHDAFNINYDYNAFRTAPEFNTNESKAIFTVGKEEIKVSKDNPNFQKEYLDKILDLLKEGKITQDEYNKAESRFKFKNADDVVTAMENQMLEEVVDTDKNSPTYGQVVIRQNPRMIKAFPIRDYMIVQPSTDHLVDGDPVVIFGSQLRNIIPADLPADFTMEIPDNNGGTVTLNREEAVQYYNTLIVDQLLDSFARIDKRFSDIHQLQKALFNAMKGNPKYGDDVKAALEIDENTGTFKMPFNSPNLSNKIEELILSVFKNNIQRQKIKGGNVVLVSNFGISDKLQIKYNNDDKSQGIEYIPAYMPAYMREMYSDYLIQKTDSKGNSYYTIDFEALRKNNDEDILRIIGYRIPTEDKYSIMPIKIVGFLPLAAGSTIILPSDIVAMSGTDFDIDKLFLMIKDVRREVFDARLSHMFLKKLKNEGVKDSDHKNLDKVTKIIKSHLRNKRGFTQKEIDKLAASGCKYFNDFLKSEAVQKIKHPRPKYVTKKAPIITKDGKIDISATSKMEGINERDRKAYRDNMLIDTIWGVLTNPKVADLLMTPGSFPSVKKASRIRRILDEPVALRNFAKQYKDLIKQKGYFGALMSLSTKELEQFFDDYSRKTTPYGIVEYTKKHRNLMDGNDLIGGCAVNSSNHYKLQFLNSERKDYAGNYIEKENLIINADYRFNIFLPGMKEPVEIQIVSPQRSPITGVRIGRICAEYQAASPDNGKDPCLGDLGANMSTLYLFNLTEQVGIPPEVAGIINGIDDLVSYGKKCKAYDKVPFNGDINRVVELLVKLRLSEEGVLIDPDDQSDAAKIAEWFGKINHVASFFKGISTVSRCDSPNGALPVNAAEALQQKFKAEEFMTEARSKDAPIKGLNRLVDITLDATKIPDKEILRNRLLAAPIPRMQAFYTLGLASARTLAGTVLEQFSEAVQQGIDLLREESKRALKSKKDLKDIKKFMGELPMFLLSQGSLFASDTEGKTIMEKRNYYIHDFPMRLNSYLQEKDKDGNYIHNNIRNLPLIKRLTNANRRGITLQNIGKIHEITRKHYTEGLISMLHSEDPEVVKLAVDLLMYSYYDNGLNFGPFNFGNFFTTEFLQSMPRYVDVLKAQNGKLKSDPSMIVRYVYQFMLNHKDMLFDITKLKSKWTYNKDNQTIVISTSGGNVPYAIQRKGGGYIKYIKWGNIVYQRVDGLNGGSANAAQVTYQRVDSNMTNIVGNKVSGRNYTPYYDATTDASEIDWSSLKPRGPVVTLTDAEKKLSQKKKWDNKEVPNGYEVSTAAKRDGVIGDARFSALNAKFAEGTKIEGVDVSNKTIEWVYQNVMKKSGKGQPPAQDSKLYNPDLKTKEAREDFSYEKGYLPLWKEWAKQNPELIEELRTASIGRVLTDRFATTKVSQARALADILNETADKKNEPKEGFEENTPNISEFNEVPEVGDGSEPKEFDDIDQEKVPEESSEEEPADLVNTALAVTKMEEEKNNSIPSLTEFPDSEDTSNKLCVPEG